MLSQEPSRRQKVAASAALVVRSAVHTHYQHTPVIDPRTGTYKLDCSEFVSYVLQEAAPEHYARIPKVPTQPRPRAFEYCDYLESLTYEPGHGWRRRYNLEDVLVYEAAQGWRRVLRIEDARRGDVIAWRFARWAPGTDTGHVLLVADRAEQVAPGLFAVRVFDSSQIVHYDDSREESGAFVSGVGVGTLHFHVGRTGAPTAVQFGPGDRFHALPIVIGRLEPLHF